LAKDFAMTQPSFRIEDTFLLDGRGLVLVAVVDESVRRLVCVRIGDQLELVTKDHLKVNANVIGIELAGFQPNKNMFGILVAAAPDLTALDLRNASATVLLS
jgi:hypothetical protein